MKKESAEIQYFDSQTVLNIEQHLLIDNSSGLRLRERVRLLLLKALLGAKNSLVYVFSIKEEIFAIRTELEKLKDDTLIASYGEGSVYADYPHFNFFGISFQIASTGSLLRSWGYTLPFESKELAIKNALWETCERHASFYESKVTTITYPRMWHDDASFLFETIPHFTADQISRDTRLVGEIADMKAMLGFKARSLTGDKTRFLPAHCFYWGTETELSEKRIHDATTSGSGGGATKASALLRALYELIERDNFLLHWLSGVAPKQIVIGSAQGELFDHIRDARARFNLEVYFFDIGYDFEIPVSVCLIVDPVLHLVAFGGKASSSGETTLRGAYLEALATLSVLRKRGKRVSEEDLKKIIAEQKFGNGSIDQTTRVNLYHSALGIATVKKIMLNQDSATIDFVVFNEKTKMFNSFDQEFDSVLANLKELVDKKGPGYHAYAHFFSSEFTKRFDSYAAHVYIPALLKLHLNEHFVAPLSSRLFEFVHAHGRHISDEKGLNPLPHPFP